MSDREIQEAVRKLAGTNLTDEVFIVECTVTDVDIPSRTCSCTSIGGSAIVEINNVQLMAAVDDGFFLIPSIDSTVFVVYSKRVLPTILLFSQIDQAIIIAGSTTVTIKDGSLQFNDGSFGGLIKIEDLVKKLNNIEKLVNDLVTKFNSHTHILTLSSGTGTAAPTVTQEGQTLTPTQKEDIENSTINHGQ